ncbi:MAG TPA: DUF1080 domain-containing protein [bacterium]|nr:DUF1080 domain-containing protein [bacterium]HPN45387.1 DUF1080 domain-containing protein [bacterium]
MRKNRFLLRPEITIITVMIFLCCTAFTKSKDDGYIKLIKQNDKGEYNQHGWNHYGPGYFTLDKKTGVLTGYEGMGLYWFSEKKFKNFILELDYMTELPKSNSGIFVRVPELVTNDDYIYKAFEIQIDDHISGIHKTGAVYDAKAPDDSTASKGPGQWNHFKITCSNDTIKVELNNKLINTWKITTPIGKIKEWYPEGYIGLQNHDADNSTQFKDVKIKELP